MVNTVHCRHASCGVPGLWDPGSTDEPKITAVHPQTMGLSVPIFWPTDQSTFAINTPHKNITIRTAPYCRRVPEKKGVLHVPSNCQSPRPEVVSNLSDQVFGTF